MFMLRIQQTLFHFTSYGCRIKPSFFHTSYNQFQSLLSFLSKSHDQSLRKSIKVFCNKITIVIIAFCVVSFLWYLSKQTPFCDESSPDGVFFVKQNTVSADLVLAFFTLASWRKIGFCHFGKNSQIIQFSPEDVFPLLG